ncbi:MAG: MFS transporter [Sphingobium sp.]
MAESEADMMERTVPAQERALPGGLSSWLLLALLMAVYIFSYLDRNIFALLMPQMSKEFGLTDSEIGQLTGLAFPVVFAIMSLISAVAADRLNRVRLIAGSVGLFSIMTMLCGAAQGYWSLFWARLGVGVGEGSTNPPSISLIADNFHGPARQFANSVIGAASTVGLLCAFLIFGNIAAAFGWRIAFLGAGILGAVIALLVFLFLRDTVRSGSGQAMSFRDFKRFPMLFRIRSFRWIVCAAIAHTICTQASFLWMPMFLTRSLHMSQVEISWYLGLNYSFLSLLGIGGGTWIATRLRRKSVGATQWLGCGVMLTLGTAFLMVFLAPSATWTLVALSVVIMLTASNYGSLLAFIQDITPHDAQARASAINFCVMQIGLGFGSLLIGMLSDRLVPHAGADSLRYAMLPVTTIAALLAAIFYFVASRTGDRDAMASGTLPQR